MWLEGGRCNERLAIQFLFAEFTLLFRICGLNIHKTAKNTVFSLIIDIIPLSADKYALLYFGAALMNISDLI